MSRRLGLVSSTEFDKFLNKLVLTINSVIEMLLQGNKPPSDTYKYLQIKEYTKYKSLR